MFNNTEKTDISKKNEINHLYMLLKENKNNLKESNENSNFSFNFNILTNLAYHIQNIIPQVIKELNQVITDIKLEVAEKNNERGKYYLNWILKDILNNEIREYKKRVLLNAFSYINNDLVEQETETDLYSQRNISNSGLFTHQAIKCLYDMTGRTLPFIQGLMKSIKKDMFVCEIGAGTGIMAISSLLCGSKKVVALEINPITCLLAKLVVEYCENNNFFEKNKIEVFWADAIQWENKKYSYSDFDLILSENLYTGMFYEKQVQIMNEVNKKKSKKITNFNQILLPKNIVSFLQPVMLSDIPKTKSLTVIELHNQGISEIELDKPKKYNSIDFYKLSSKKISSKNKFIIKCNGRIDALLLYSEITITSDIYISRNENEFLNNDHIVVLPKSISVLKGDKIEISFIYNAGGLPEDSIITIKVI